MKKNLNILLLNQALKKETSTEVRNILLTHDNHIDTLVNITKAAFIHTNKEAHNFTK